MEPLFILDTVESTQKLYNVQVMEKFIKNKEINWVEWTQKFVVTNESQNWKNLDRIELAQNCIRFQENWTTRFNTRENYGERF